MEQYTEKKKPKVLVISHNIFSESTGMGKTLASMLACIPPDRMAQLYFHSEVPTIGVCKNYFRITDVDMVKSLFSRHAKYHIFDDKDIRCGLKSSRTDKGMLSKIYQFSRKRTPMIYNFRNLLWRMGKWDSKALEKWICDFSPDVIFFASGDYVFSYRIVQKLAERYKLPIVIWCCDDYYISRRNRDSIGGNYCYKKLMKAVHHLSSQIASVVVISEKMKQDYTRIFRQTIDVIRISAEENPYGVTQSMRSRMVYAGSLGVNRIIPLVELGRVIKKSQIEGYEQIDVYSGEQNEHILELLTEENGICFHGKASQEEVTEIIGHARYVLHLEAFDENSKSRTRYSLSTKIGEYLQSGACILAYGPEDISSMEYLAEHQAAVCIKDACELNAVVRNLNQKEESYQYYVDNAKKLACKCHNKEMNDKTMLKILQDAVNNKR